MTVKEIVKKYLEDNKYDGLYSKFCICSCILDNLMPCEYNAEECKAGHKKNCEECDSYKDNKCEEDLDHCIIV